MNRNSTSRNNIFVKNNDQLWVIKNNRKKIINMINVKEVFKKLIIKIAKKDINKIPFKGSFDKKNITLRKKLGGKFIIEGEHDFNFWYVDTKRFERHFFNTFELMNILRSFSVKKSKVELDKIKNL